MEAIISRKAPMLGDRTRKEKAVTVKSGDQRSSPGGGQCLRAAPGLSGHLSDCPALDMGQDLFLAFMEHIKLGTCLSVFLFFHFSFNLSCKSWT